MATKDSEKNTTNPRSVHVIEYYLENGQDDSRDPRHSDRRLRSSAR
jgi:hypothetical protein